MTVLLTLSTTAGILLGLRFKALVLCPVIIVAAIAMAGIGTVTGSSLGAIILHMCLVIVALQMGYVGGCILRHPLPLTERSHYQRSAPLGY